MLIDHSDFRSASLQWAGKLDKAGKARVVGFNHVALAQTLDQGWLAASNLSGMLCSADYAIVHSEAAGDGAVPRSGCLPVINCDEGKRRSHAG